MKFKWHSIVFKTVILIVGLNLLFGSLLIGLNSEELLNQYENLLNDKNVAHLKNIKGDFEVEMYNIESSTYALGTMIEELYPTNDPSMVKLDELEDRIVVLFSDYLDSELASSYSVYTYLEPQNEDDVHDIWMTNQEQSLIRHEEIPYQRYVEKDNMTWFYDVKDSGHSFWVAPYRNRYNQYISSYVMPLYSEDHFIGILGMYLDINKIRNSLSYHNESNENYFWVSNQHNKVVYHPLLDDGATSPLIVTTDKMNTEYIDEAIDGELYRHYLTTTHNGWTFINSIKYDHLLKSRVLVIKRVFISFILFFIALIFILVIISNKYANYINEMISSLKNGQVGNFSKVLPLPFKDEMGTLGHVINDTLETFKKEQIKLKHIAYYNLKTGLPNLEQLKQTLLQNSNKNMVLYILDLDNYRSINDLLGKDQSDALINEIGKKMKEAESQGLELFHIAGDEFAFLDLTPELFSITAHAEHILDSLRQFAFSTKYNITISGSIGIAKYPDDNLTTSGLINCASTALSVAKKEGRDKYKLYSRFLSSHNYKTDTLSDDFKIAIKENQFTMHYQTIFNQANEMVSIEAFVRWDHHSEGLQYPKAILHLAEHTGLLAELSNLIIINVCKDYNILTENHIYPTKINVNLNHRQLLNPLFISNTLSILRQEDMNPELIAFDITEEIIQYDLDQSIKKLKALKVIGIETILDNYGNSTSSLSTLKRLPIQKIKIDSCLTHNLHDNTTKALVNGIIFIGHQLGLIIVGECIESSREYNILCEMGCDQFQGNHLQEPLDLKNFIKKSKEKSRI